MTILVTGGAGFIGSNFIRYFLNHHPQDKIINLDKLTYSGNLLNLREIQDNPHYKFVKGDIADSQVVQEAMEGVDMVVNFAAESHVDRSILDPYIFFQTNVLGTQVLLETALKTKVKRFHHISCYDEKTRALTKDGLKYFWELSKDDEVLSLNLKTREIEWKNIEKVIVQDYRGSMVRIKSDRIDFLVTPNHRMLLETPRKRNLIFKQARNLGARNILPRGIWNSKHKIDANFMYFLGFFIGDGFLAYQEKKLPNITGLTKNEYLSLARDPRSGQFITIGRVGSNETTTSRAFRIFLDVPKKDSARRRVEKSLTNLGVNWHEHSGKAGEHLYFTSEKFFEILKDCGQGAKNKTIPRWALETDQESLKALFDGLIDSDGHRARNLLRFMTSSQKLVEDFSELCVKLGLTPHIFIRESEGNDYNGRIIKGGKSYLITVAKTNRSIIPRYGLNHVKNTYYKGKIWCVKVPKNQNLLVERSGIFAFCGNTDEVWGSLELDSKEKFTEETIYRPRSPYAASKAAADHLVRAYFETYGLAITISNCSNNFGPYQFPEKVLPLFITNALEDRPLPLYGDGLYVRDWIYVEDHCLGIDLVLEKGKVGETYLVGAENEISNLDLAERVLAYLGKSDKLIKHVPDRPGHDRRYGIDPTKIRRELGFKPKYSFEGALKKTIDWYKQNELWWKPLKKEVARQGVWTKN